MSDRMVKTSTCRHCGNRIYVIESKWQHRYYEPPLFVNKCTNPEPTDYVYDDPQQTYLYDDQGESDA